MNSLPDYEAHIQLCPLIDALHKKKRIIVIAGAGISVAAGIPTFDNMPVGSRRIFDMHMYNNDEDTKRLHQMMCDMYHRVHAASATQFHLMLAALAEEGRLLRLYTQNIDGIDTQLAPLRTLIPLPKKGPWPKTVQLHGDLRTVRCLRNLHLSSFDPALFDSGVLPFCEGCEEDERSNKGRRTPRSIPTVPVTRPRIWLYNDFNYPDEEAITKVMAADFKAKPDAIIVVGTALKVASAKIFAQDICRAAHEYGGFTAWINLQAPPRGLDCLSLVVKGNCETVAEH
ncbi:DHS-like NAD/FAD-binding domain-containing protein, partial [Halenospora varia]